MADTATKTADSRPAGDEEIELSQLIGTLFAGKWIIAAFIVITVMIGGWQAYTATPIYKGDMLLQVERHQAAIPGLGNILGTEAMETDTEIELLRSRMVMGAVLIVAVLIAATGALTTPACIDRVATLLPQLAEKARATSAF
jgi:tyrosine-protein kinase Etk/Wzc